MATTTNPILPVELRDEILGYLVADSDMYLDRATFRTLLACNLTCRQFAAAARRRLFSTLVIDRDAWQMNLTQRRWKGRSVEDMSNRINALINLLTNNDSNLALVVRRLEISCVVLRQESNLHGLLTVLSERALEINHLTMHICGFHCLSWYDLPYQISESLERLCRSLLIHGLHFLYLIDIPPSIVAAQSAPHFEYISLTRSGFQQSDLRPRAILSDFTSTEANLDPVLTQIPNNGKYKICHTDARDLSIVGVHINISSVEDEQRVNQLISNEHLFHSLQSIRWYVYLSYRFCLVRVIDNI